MLSLRPELDDPILGKNFVLRVLYILLVAYTDSDYTTHVADAEAFMASARGYLRSESLRKASVSPSRPPVTTAQPAQKASRSFSESPTRRSAIRNPVQAPAKNVAPEKALSPRPIVNLPINPAAVTRKIIDKAAVAATKIVDTPKPIHKDQLPKTLVEDLLIDFSSDDDTPRQSTKALSKLSNELLVDLGDEFFDAPEDAGGKGILSETTQKQLLGLDLTPSKLPLSLDKGYDLEGMGAEDVDEILQNKTAQATGMIRGLGECMSILVTKISDALHQPDPLKVHPERLCTPPNKISGQGRHRLN